MFSSSPVILPAQKIHGSSHWKKLMAIITEKDEPPKNMIPLNILWSPSVPLILRISNTVRTGLWKLLIVTFPRLKVLNF